MNSDSPPTFRKKTFQIPATMNYKPISGYGIIGNRRTIGLVGYDGSIDWCCLPKMDSPSIFGAILDYRVGGSWSITSAEKGTSSQTYIENTNILQTEFQMKSGKVTITDFMPVSLYEEWTAFPEIHRVVDCTEGEATMKLILNPRFEYGRRSAKILKSKHGLTMISRKYEMALASTLEIQPQKDGLAHSVFKISKGQREIFVLSYGEFDPRDLKEYETSSQLLRTEAFWKHWVGGLKYNGAWSSAVIRSALALKLLEYSPTGAIVAAPTCSLPEAIGGNRNWDYRFSWIRDSSNSLWAFHLLGDKSASERFLHWLVDNNPSLELDVHLMYSIDGDTKITESILNHLEGYRRSKPVRIGNAAAKQVQFDACGYMLDALYFSTRYGSSVSEQMYYRFVKPLARYICENWGKPGNGIWEIRGRREHHVYTNAWCYAGLDRAVKIGKMCGHEQDTSLWLSTMEEIKRDVLEKGWDNRKKSFVMSYENRGLDSSALMLPLIGFIDINDEKMQMTIRAIRKGLGRGSLLFRYKIDDDLQGIEGAFLLCSFWLIACLARSGKIEEAKKMFDRVLAYANHLGLYSEEIDPKSGESLGNFPQAFSHMGLIMAAHEIEQASNSANNPT